MNNTRSYNWSWFHDEIHKAVKASERYCGPLLDLVGEVDVFVSRVLDRQTSPFSERPQDYVVSILTARAFRLTVSSLYIGLGGYPDSETNLQRTVWEIFVRLLDMTEAPVGAALGFLLGSCASEVSHMEAELHYRRDKGLPTYNLPRNRDVSQRYYDNLKQMAQRKGLDPEAIQRKHGRLNYLAVCKRFGLEKAYRVDYAFYSGYVHEKNQATADYVFDSAQSRGFQLGPVSAPGGPTTTAFDDLTNLTRVLEIAARIVEDPALVQDVSEFADRLIGRYTQDSEIGA